MNSVGTCKLSWRDWWVPLLVVAAVSLYLFGYYPYNFGYAHESYSVVHNLWLRWESDTWAHGMLVPFIALFIVWRKWRKLSALPVQGANVWGLALLAGSMILYWMGYAIDVTYFSYFTLHLFIASLVLWFFGWAWLKELMFPIAFLLFAFPYDFLESAVTLPLRHIMAGLASVVLNVMGIAVVKMGTGLVSAPDPFLGLAEGQRFRLDVADPCSGMRSLFALLMFSALYAYFILRDNRHRWILFVCAIPMAVVGNVVRIILLTLGTLWWGADVAIGSLEKPTLYHTGAGIAVFVVALIGLMTIGHILENFSSRLVPLFRSYLNKLIILSQNAPREKAKKKSEDSY